MAQGRRPSKLASSQANQFVTSAINASIFPLNVVYPEDEKIINPVALFHCRPRFVWAPEAKAGRKCWKCKQILRSALGYQCREVQDVSHTTDLYFARYKCHNCNITFSTVSSEYLQSLAVEIQDAFPYTLTHKNGIF